MKILVSLRPSKFSKSDELAEHFSIFNSLLTTLPATDLSYRRFGVVVSTRNYYFRISRIYRLFLHPADSRQRIVAPRRLIPKDQNRINILLRNSNAGLVTIQNFCSAGRAEQKLNIEKCSASSSDFENYDGLKLTKIFKIDLGRNTIFCSARQDLSNKPL